MVGGIVIGIARREDRVLLNVRDRRAGGSLHEVRVIETCVPIRIGDAMWWNDDEVMWTPAPTQRGGVCGKDFDIILKRAVH